MKYIFTALFLFTSLEASGDLFTHLHTIYSNHLPELLFLTFIIILPFILIVYFILNKKNEQLKIKVGINSMTGVTNSSINSKNWLMDI